jgi:hypothetical protein
MRRSILLGVVLAALVSGCGDGKADQRSGQLRGVVALSSTKGGSPIPFAHVQAVKVGGGGGDSTSSFRAAADSDGHFTMKLPAGRYTVTLVLKAGTAHVRDTVLIRAGQVSRVRLVEFAT